MRWMLLIQALLCWGWGLSPIWRTPIDPAVTVACSGAGWLLFVEAIKWSERKR